MPETPITVRPLTPDLAPAFLDLFGPSGACYGCWCQHFRLPPKLRDGLPGADKRQLMLDRIRRGPPPGLLALAGDQAIGWMQIGPRADVPEWNNPRRASTPLADGPADDPRVWAVSCFFFRAAWRGRGLSHRMLSEGISFARKGGARLLEAAPLDRAKRSGSIALYVGSTAVFDRAGFVEVARQRPGRPLMRLEIGA